MVGTRNGQVLDNSFDLFYISTLALVYRIGAVPNQRNCFLYTQGILSVTPKLRCFLLLLKLQQRRYVDEF